MHSPNKRGFMATLAASAMMLATGQSASISEGFFNAPPYRHPAGAENTLSQKGRRKRARWTNKK